MVQGMTLTTKRPAPVTRKPSKTAKATMKKLKNAWPATVAIVLVGIVASGSIMASVPPVNSNAVSGPPAAGAEPKPDTRRLPGDTPAPAINVPFFVDSVEDSVGLMNITKGT